MNDTQKKFIFNALILIGTSTSIDIILDRMAVDQLSFDYINSLFIFVTYICFIKSSINLINMSTLNNLNENARFEH